MTGRIPDNILEDILNKTDIVEVISSFMPLKRAGRNFRALCPFHHEKTPSFMVSADRQIYHCFGCHESGNAFKFLMRHERMEFPEAVESLAKRAGVVLPQSPQVDSGAANLTTQLHKINELAAAFYENNLNSSAGERAKSYILERGLEQATIKSLRLGLALDSWDALLNHLRSKGIAISLLEKAGLILAKERGGYYDRFRSRLIFPIFDAKDRVIAFGARVLDNTLPKYINSPETPVYIKGKNPYGINLAKEAIRENDAVVVVEGYLDFIMPYQHGIKNIVASLGTALTIEQVKILKRHTPNVVMVYDGDSAGELATLRSLDIFIEEEMNVKVAALPQGFDPDSYVRKYGPVSLKGLIQNARNLFDYKLAVLKSRYNHRDIEGKTRIASSMLETLSKFKNAILKSEYIKQLSAELDIKEEAILQEIKKINRPAYPLAQAEPVNKKPANINAVERLLVKLMLEESGLINRIKDNIEPADFQDERASRVVLAALDLARQGKDIEPNFLLSYLGEDDGLSQFICESLFISDNLSAQDKEKAVDDCIKRLKSQNLKTKLEHLHHKIKAAQDSGDEEGLYKLMEEFHYLSKKK